MLAVWILVWFFHAVEPRPYVKAQTPLLRFVVDLLYNNPHQARRVVTNRTDARRRACCADHDKYDDVDGVDALVLFTSPTALYVYNKSTAQATLPVTCNNNTPILQHGGFWSTNWLNLCAELSQCRTKQKLRMRVNVRIVCVSNRRGISKYRGL